MAKYRLDSIAALARQMEFAPDDVRLEQVARAEELLHLIDPAKAYPLDFVIYRITEYRPKGQDNELLTGLALQHDLGLLIESVSDSVGVVTTSLAEPVLAIDDVCEKFNVTSKTIQRWRRKGLPARRFVFGDGRKRVGFLLSSVERFLANHNEHVLPAANFSQVGDEERVEILRRARVLATHCTEEEITRRIARGMNRSPLTVLHTIRKHDQEAPADAILANAATPIADADRIVIGKAFKRGVTIKQLARKFGRPRSAIYRVVLQDRVERLNRRKVRFHDDPLFHGDDAEQVIESLANVDALQDVSSGEESRMPRDLPPYLQELYRTPLLTKARERGLFLQLNYYKWQFVQARRRLDPDVIRHRDLLELEALLAKIAGVKNQIVRANLRLVVSVARKHARPGMNLLELVSDGNLTLMRAVDGFDVGKGNRFSTYATLALMKGFARSVPEMLAKDRHASIDEYAEHVPDARGGGNFQRLLERDHVSRLMSVLSERERDVLAAHFGLGDGGPASTYEQVGQRLGLSKERVRQIEQGALAKLRAMVQA
jgi:RNA polymerase primary sigma factor